MAGIRINAAEINAAKPKAAVGGLHVNPAERAAGRSGFRYNAAEVAGASQGGFRLNSNQAKQVVYGSHGKNGVI
jgi:hypothetical protein